MTRAIVAGLTAILGMAACTLVARAEDETIPLDKVPPAVMAAVKAKFPGAEIKGAEKEVEDGKTTFEIELKDAGRDVDVALSADGTILEIEKELPIADLPRPVAAAVKAKYPKATLKTAEEITKGEAKSYEVVVEEAGRKKEVALDSKGKILENEEDD